MLKKLNSNIVIALLTACALIAFAFNQRYGTAIEVPRYVFYVAAAIICVLPEFYARSRRRACRNNPRNAA